MKTLPKQVHNIVLVIPLCLLACAPSLHAQATIVKIPGLGGSVTEVNAVNKAGMVAGFSRTPGDADQHAFLFYWSALYDLGGFFSLASCINSNGLVAGDSYNPDTFESHAFLFTPSGNTDLGTLGGSSSTAAGINDSGLVVGNSYLPGDAGPSAFLYSDGAMTNLGGLGGSYSSAAAINSAGQIVGESYTANDAALHAFLFSAGVASDLGTLGGASSSAKFVNNAGQAAGDADTANQSHAFFYDANGIHDVGTLGGSYSTAYGLNDFGQVIGDAATANDATSHAFIYYGGVLADLGTLGGTFSTANAINNNGQVVGASAITNGNARAFLWSNGTMTDVNTLLPLNSGWVLQSAAFINDAGQIVGSGLLNGVFNWFLLTPPSNHPPVAKAGPAQNLQCPAVAQLDGSGSSDPDGDALAYQWSENNTPLASGVTASVPLAIGTHTIVLTVTDTHGATAQDTVVVTVVDTTSPVIACANSVTVSANANCQAVIPDFLAGVIVTDNCTPVSQLVKSQSPVAGTAVGPGAYLITVTVSDGAGNNSTCMATLTVADSTPPVVSCPAAVTNLADATGHAVIPNIVAGVVASDNCTPAAQLTKTQNPAAGTLVGLGAYTVSISVADASGNASACNVVFTVTDKTPPTVTGPPPRSASANANCQATVPDFLADLSATDNCTLPGDLVKVQTPAAGTLADLGVHPVTITVTDASGNTSSCGTTFTVVDTTPPSVSCPAAVTVSADGTCQGSVPNFLAGVSASDNCSSLAQLVKTQNPAAGTVVGIGPHVVTITVTDAAGNANTCTTTFTVADTTPPAVNCPAPVTASADGNCQAAVPNFLANLVASDSCSPQLVKTQTPAAGTLVGRGAHPVTITVSDSSGNVSTCTTTFTVVDTTAPVIASVAATPNVLTPADGAFVPVTVTVSQSDNCDASPVCRIISVTSSEPVTGPGDKTSPDWVITGNLTANLRAERAQKGNGRIYTITVQCTDASGNSSTGVTTVFVPRK